MSRRKLRKDVRSKVPRQPEFRSKRAGTGPDGGAAGAGVATASVQAGAGVATASVQAGAAARPQFRLTPLVAGLLLVALAAAVYLNILRNDFVIDDRAQIVQNEAMHRPDGLREIFTTGVWSFLKNDLALRYYRPLMYAFWFPLWRIFHENPLGYHALSIVLHAAVSLLVFLWLRRMQPNPAIAWLAALLFAVHPIHTEAVDWISAVPDLECALFFLLGFWLYLAAEQAAGWRRYAMQTGVAACVLLGLLAKEIGFVLPLMLLLYEWNRRRTEAGSGARSPKIFAYAAIALAVVAYLAMRLHAVGSLISQPSGGTVVSVPPGKFISLCAVLFYEYAARIVVPLRLSAAHTVPLPSGFPALRAVAGLTVAAGLCALAVWLYRRRRVEWLGVVLFLAALLPTFFVPVRAYGFWMGERYLYLPSVGFCWLLAAGLARASEFRRKWVAVFAVALVFAYAARTVHRNRDWRYELPFYLHELRTEGESLPLRISLLEEYMRGHFMSPEQAVEHAQAWVRLAPRDAHAHWFLGELYWNLEKTEEALSEHRLAAVSARDAGDIAFAAQEFNNLAVLYSQAGRLDPAIDAYQEAVRLYPDSADGRYNLGLALLGVGRAEEAATQLRAAIRLNPSLPSAHANLASALAALRDWPAARAAVAEALRLDPNGSDTVARAGEIEAAAGNRKTARQWFDRALAMNPTNPRALAGLAAEGRRQQAVSSRQ